MQQRLRLGAPPTRGVRWILGLIAAVFIVWLFADDTVKAYFTQHLALSADGAFRRGELWQLFLAPFINLNGIALLFDVLMLWLFVPTLEKWWGTKRFLIFFAATSFAGALVAALVGLFTYPYAIASGVSPFIYASIAAFGVLFSGQQVALFGIFKMSGRALAIGIVVVIGFVTLLEKDWVRGAGSLGAMALAWWMTSGGWTPNLMILKLRRWWLRRRYKVIDGGKKKDEKRWMN